MTSETRVNVIALALILAVMLPGGVMMFRKKMRPGATAILGQPDPVRRVVPYMEPLDMPVHQRVVPPRTWAWAEGLAAEFGVRTVMVEGTSPVMSERRGIQVLGANPGSVVVLVWREAPPQALRIEPGEVRRAGARAVPAKVRRELQDTGYIDPPRTVVLVEVAPGVKQTTGPIRIHVKQNDENGRWEDFVTLFTNPADTNK